MRWLLLVLLLIAPLPQASAQESGASEDGLRGAESQAAHPLEIVIRPRQTPKGDGFYENALIKSIHGQSFRLRGYHLPGESRQVVDGKVVRGIWQEEADLLTLNILKEAGILSLPSFEERLAHELKYGNNIGWRLGGIYKDMSFLEIAYSFNIDPLPPVHSFASKGIVGGRKFNTDFSYDQQVFGVIDFGSAPHE